MCIIFMFRYFSKSSFLIEYANVYDRSGFRNLGHSDPGNVSHTWVSKNKINYLILNNPTKLNYESNNN